MTKRVLLNVAATVLCANTVRPTIPVICGEDYGVVEVYKNASKSKPGGILRLVNGGITRDNKKKGDKKRRHSKIKKKVTRSSPEQTSEPMGGTMPPDNLPPGNIPPDNMPPGNVPQGDMPHGQNDSEKTAEEAKNEETVMTFTKTDDGNYIYPCSTSLEGFDFNILMS